jgi:hypothetical protein
LGAASRGEKKTALTLDHSARLWQERALRADSLVQSLCCGRDNPARKSRQRGDTNDDATLPEAALETVLRHDRIVVGTAVLLRIQSGRIRTMKQNQGIISSDACRPKSPSKRTSPTHAVHEPAPSVMNAVEYCLLHGLKLAGPEHPALLCAQESLSYGALAARVGLSFPKIISARSDDAILTRLVW